MTKKILFLIKIIHRTAKFHAFITARNPTMNWRRWLFPFSKTSSSSSSSNFPEKGKRTLSVGWMFCICALVSKHSTARCEKNWFLFIYFLIPSASAPQSIRIWINVKLFCICKWVNKSKDFDFSLRAFLLK